MLIADLQAKLLDFSNINILSLPGPQIRDLYRFVPVKDQYNNIVIFAGGNDLYNRCLPTTENIDDVTERIVKLANKLLNISKCVFVPVIPARFPPESERELVQDHKVIRHFAVNRKLEKKNAEDRWVFRGLPDQIYCDNHVSERDHVHLNEPALSGLRRKLMQRVFYEDYSVNILERRPKVYECSQVTGCLSGSYSG